MAAQPKLPQTSEPIVDARIVDSALRSPLVTAELVSEERQSIVALPCAACGAPRQRASTFCVACGAPMETPDQPVVASGRSGASASALPDHTFECQNCGSQVLTSIDQRSFACPFCDSSYVTELPVSRAGRQRPEFVIGFAVTAQQAEEKYYEWLGKNSWFRPGDLASKAIAEKQRGVYLPFWHFSMQAQSHWSASIGEYWYRTETYTTTDSKGNRVTHTRQVQETEWWPLSGSHSRYYYGYLVPATKGISAKEAADIQPFQLSALARYRPFYLAGWMAEEYSIPMDSAIEQTMSEFRRRQEQEVTRFLPGDTSRNVLVSTELNVNGSDLILLPVHVLSYRYHNRVYRFLVNGQTGKSVGEKPWSKTRIAIVIGVVVTLVAVVATTIFLLSR